MAHHLMVLLINNTTVLIFESVVAVNKEMWGYTTLALETHSKYTKAVLCLLKNH